MNANLKNGNIDDQTVIKLKKEVELAEKNVRKLKQDREMYQTLVNKINKDLSKGEMELSELKQKLNTFNTKSFITDHATLRYLERTGIIDIKKLKNTLLTDEVLHAIYMNAEKVYSNGYEFRIKNGKIVTILYDGEEL